MLTDDVGLHHLAVDLQSSQQFLGGGQAAGGCAKQLLQRVPAGLPLTHSAFVLDVHGSQHDGCQARGTLGGLAHQLRRHGRLRAPQQGGRPLSTRLVVVQLADLGLREQCDVLPDLAQRPAQHGQLRAQPHEAVARRVP